jgi:hypothetical protein
MHWIILLFCNKQVGLVVTILFHLFHLCNALWTHWQYMIQPNSHMHYPHQSNANVMDYFFVMQYSCSRFHLIWFKNAITRLFWSYAIPCGHIDNIISNQFTHALLSLGWCNTPRTKYKYHIQQYSHLMYILWMILVFHNTLRPIKIISFYLFQQCNTLKTYWK